MNPRMMVGEPPVPVPGFIQIDALCDRFEGECRAGRTPDLAAYLVGVPDEARVPLFRNLLNLDSEYRRRRGERLDAQRYREQFPELSDVVDSVFLSLSDRSISSDVHTPDSARKKKTDPAGATRLAACIAVDVGPADLWGALSAIEYDDLLSSGYEVIRPLGRGGMGVVYEARQVSLNRFVALKLIRSGSFASVTELRRFQNEAEAVAQLDHPHIVPIYEVAQVCGRHFFSMKLIAGTSLDKRLDDFGADPRASARLVATIAEAIHHAHQRGILHRDLKPANILLDADDGPQVTDFGLAKRIDGTSDLTQSTTLVGTPSYMAPEQTELGVGGASTATDVHGLGAILYTLLAGHAPFHGSTLVETLAMVRTQYPERPSKLNRRVPRDLEVICLKCLEKEPARRYPSALALADDLSRWLRGEPILGRPVSPLVRAVMWARRNPPMATTAALAVLFLIGGFAAVTWKWRDAVRERARSEAVVELLTQRLFIRADTELNSHDRSPTVREVMDRTASTLGGWLEGQPDVEAQVREAIGGAYLSFNDFEPAAEQLRSAIRLDASANGPKARTGLRATNLLATLLDRTGKTADAEPLLRRNLADCRRVLGADDPTSLDAAERFGSVLWHAGRLDEAETVLRQSVADRTRVFTSEHPNTLRSVILLSRLVRERRRFDEARQLADRYAHDLRCALGSDHPDLIVALTNQGDVARDEGQIAQAEQFYSQAARDAARIFGPDHEATRAVEASIRHLGPLPRPPEAAQNR
jgi:eukaryotic-like serine/threonine-protein kinase